ncbi:RNA 2',3'-cyclic phosphodiesterase [Pseudoalteromonas sp. SMS1]|uniref:RNA 2',3'-cyclic phosphodiesterase n=1 Tax=Pseudoalteromonas sp. SMS1 TaxID=2908894 RepID=UPI001F2236DD|nr:RNA 2',3'-cyclic phosphodiesterase [Pseudoalteromonas sp. SMS1]MCF2858463.1 RNA 2',3'-cyclic phosphodiesterase [Pseudoalteromonas sp. SMS1]
MALKRLFFGLGLDAQAKAHISPWLNQSVSHAKPATLARNWHITLAFLAQVDESSTAALIDFARKLNLAPFELHFSHTGYWSHNGIFYLKPAPSEALNRLATPLREISEQWQLYSNPYAFSPHITLFRGLKKAPEVQSPLAPWTLTVTEFHLYHSHTCQDGLHYTPIASFGLNA